MAKDQVSGRTMAGVLKVVGFGDLNANALGDLNTAIDQAVYSVC